MKDIKEILASFVNKGEGHKSNIHENIYNENTVKKEEKVIEYKTNPFSLLVLILVGIGWILWGKEPQGGAKLGEFDEFDF